MKKTIIVFGIIIISTLVLFNLPKSTPKEIMVKEKSTAMDKSDVTQVNSSRYINYSKTSYSF